MSTSHNNNIGRTINN